jgi:hypothetical protein
MTDLLFNFIPFTTEQLNDFKTTLMFDYADKQDDDNIEIIKLDNVNNNILLYDSSNNIYYRKLEIDINDNLPDYLKLYVSDQDGSGVIMEYLINSTNSFTVFKLKSEISGNDTNQITIIDLKNHSVSRTENGESVSLDYWYDSVATDGYKRLLLKENGILEVTYDIILNEVNQDDDPTGDDPTGDDPTGDDPTDDDPIDVDDPTDDNPTETPIIPICFAIGTEVETDQGNIQIQKIDKNKHTIHGKRIIHIVKVINQTDYLIAIGKDAFGKNIPSKTILLSHNHKVMYMGQLIKVKYLLNKNLRIKQIRYDEKILYNILMDSYETINVHNLLCETLDPNHILGLLYSPYNNMNQEQKRNMIKTLNLCVETKNYIVFDLILNECKRIVNKNKH